MSGPEVLAPLLMVAETVAVLRSATLKVASPASATVPESVPELEKYTVPLLPEVPSTMIGSATLGVLVPPISRVAPAATVVVERLPPDSPREAFASARKVPAEMVVAPV